MNDVIGSVRQTLQDFLAPELRQHRAELVSIRGELTAKIEGVESRRESKFERHAPARPSTHLNLADPVELQLVGATQRIQNGGTFPPARAEAEP